MKGLELCRQFYIQCGKPLIRECLGAKADRVAAGLAGFGSECLGFDDEISRDHDFGPAFCLWLTDEDYETFGNELTEIYNSMPREFMGYSRSKTRQTAERHGVTRISLFYSRFTGCRDIPADEISWLKIPEHLLAAAVNGEVFDDTLGEFTRIRNGLLNFYPDDVRLKKLAA
ncbi:MAG: DUF4037 domain-containing protein, partial [Synergistes sp.]|nr:DUF4037 domain-containing protein [Synergistes sp.]